MKNLSKEKRDRILLILVGTAVILIGGWYGVINTQKSKLTQIDRTVSEQRQSLDNGRRLLSNRASVAERVAAASARLREVESMMASGDMYSWIILKVNKFKANYKVEIPQFTREVTGEVELLPNFPYKSATFTVRGTAFYHDFGVFLADFENTFPYMRVQNIELEPAVASAATSSSGPSHGVPIDLDDREKLSFRMEIVALINPGLH